MKFNILLNKRIRSIFLIMWPPFGETHESAASISVGICFFDLLKMYVISTDKEDNWSPKITIEDEPKSSYSHLEFPLRLRKWRSCELDAIIDYEYYDFTRSKKFCEIVGQNILDVEFISVLNDKPFGVKLKFENDFLTLTPISDGSTVETKNFGLISNINHFPTFGDINFSSIRQHDKAG